MKTNGNGDSLWAKVYGGIYVDGGHSIKQTFDGGLIIAAHTDSITNAIGRLYLIKTDANGDSLWSKTYGFASRNGDTYSVIQTADSGYALLGYIKEQLGWVYPFYDIYLFRTNSIGDTLWSRTYGGSADDQAYCIQNTQDGGFIIGASTTSFGAGSYDAYLIRTDINGDTLWTKTYGGLDNEWCNYVYPTSDNGFIFVGSTESFSSGGYDVYFVKTDSLGNEQWHRTFGGVNNDYGYSVQPTFDGGYIIVGIRGTNIYLIKTDGNGIITSVNEINIDYMLSQIKVFPNPFTNQLTFELSNNKESTIILYDFLSRQILRQTFVNSTTINTEQLADGIYFYELKNFKGTITNGKIIKN